MAIAPWRATCIQIESKIVCNAPDKAATLEIIDTNLSNALSKIRAACEGPNPPKLVVLPEFVFTGPQRHVPASEWIDRACFTMPGKITDTLGTLAREFGIYIAGNHFEVDPKWPDRYFNSSFLLDPKGEIILRYRRINTGAWTSPHDILDEYRAEYGEDGIFPVVDTELGRLAIYPCGEVNVPEITRVFMLRGAEVILHPNNEPLTPIADMAKQCRAHENMVYIISTNLAGTAGFSDTLTGGHSMIVDYRGNRIAYEESAEETIECSAMIDVEAQRAARRELSMGNSILRTRLEMYREYYGKAEVYPANALAGHPVETGDDFTPVQQSALDNLIKAGIVKADA